ncbi:hypothetical protein SCALM49S_03310 [Streptomyces californicus]
MGSWPPFRRGAHDRTAGASFADFLAANPDSYRHLLPAG